MNIEETKKELSQYPMLLKRIERKEQERKRWLEIGTKITPVYSDMPKAQNQSNKIEQAAIARAQIAGELAQEICELAKRRKRIEQAISSLSDEKQRLIMEKHYIDRMTFEQIAEDMDLSIRHVIRLRNESIFTVCHCMSQSNCDTITLEETR